MKKWELARYLIDAKKCVDSLYYIYDNISIIHNLDLRGIVKERKTSFYLNLCFILDECFKNKKDICSKDKIVKNIYYNRDKNIAHKDYNFEEKGFNTLEILANEFKEIILHVFNITKANLPDVLTLDFIRYDNDLFRFINKINFNDEEEIKKNKYPNYGKNIDISDSMNIFERKIFHDVDDIKKIKNKNEYAIVLDAGLNSYEYLHNMQDSCIKINVLCDENMWMHMSNKESFKFLELLKKYNFIDQYEMLNCEEIKKNESLFKSILDGDN